jgi:hypothetical protein
MLAKYIYNRYKLIIESLQDYHELRSAKIIYSEHNSHVKMPKTPAEHDLTIKNIINCTERSCRIQNDSCFCS